MCVCVDIDIDIDIDIDTDIDILKPGLLGRIEAVVQDEHRVEM